MSQEPGQFTFVAELWVWEAKAPSSNWIFVSVPEEFTEEILLLGGPPKGFGSIRVEVSVDDQTWRTSVFPSKDGGYVLPVKAPVRRRSGVEAGDDITVNLRVIES